MSAQIIIGLAVNTLCFGWMGFTNKETGILKIAPNNKYLVILDAILTTFYFLSFLVIIFSPGNMLINIGISLLMQIFINHLIWGTITGIISNLILKKSGKI
jgi:hypothetical protein